MVGYHHARPARRRHGRRPHARIARKMHRARLPSHGRISGEPYRVRDSSPKAKSRPGGMTIPRRPSKAVVGISARPHDIGV